MKVNEIFGHEDFSRESFELQLEPPDLVLVVEDDVATRQHAAEMMIRSVYEARRIPNDTSIWEALKAQHYDLLIQRARMKFTPVIVIVVGGADVPIIKQHFY